MKTYQKMLFGIAVPPLVLASIVVARTATVESKQLKASPQTAFHVDPGEAAGRLAAAIRYKTISVREPEVIDGEAFLQLHEYLEQSFPLVHRKLDKEVISDYSLLYTWKGSSQRRKPVLIAAHLDVVPVEAAAGEQWTHPPFAGRIADGHVWGRGAMDVKLAVTASLEAVETLLGAGFRPRRTVYLAYGHDEEIGGRQGAARITELLKKRGVRLDFSLDEGMVILLDAVPGLTRPAALIGLAEKGYLTLEIAVRGKGGHSSKPPRLSVIARLARALQRLEQRQMPAALRPPIDEMLDYLAPEIPFFPRMFLANRWLFGRFIVSRFEQSPEMNAAVRTTMAPTIIKGGVRENVMPSEATATVNLRLLSGDTIEDVLEHVRAAIDDSGVKVRVVGNPREASSVSSSDSPSFAVLHRTVREVFPDAIVAPALTLGGTDSKHYAKIAESSFRLVPMRLRREDLQRVHGIDERISVKNYAEIVRFYARLIQNTNAQ